jgi:pyruvate/2-oxoglutarate/acetoin dehydrogenase E1 component
MKAQQISKKENSTARSARKLNGAHHGVRPLVEIQFLHFLLLFFDICFLILYHLNRKHTNFQLNWTEGVAYRNSIIFSTKFKAPSQL